MIENPFKNPKTKKKWLPTSKQIPKKKEEKLK